ncbi:hypothetical protein HAPAU_10030 [Halalkalicoccus paucihalophilus]|uniref:Uncharacterized protein n=1 Tax=Halalkalicoccus paucihalophilus TaxID=1008153 RepID=A0A151AHL8_9EURY|nr:hypothetical protein [Halalkalicoccus paucihalophilus]KYH27113.1 hypothetical protein HAPAU_10030 [Halalkalicoccus paucihalophilus]
MSENDPERRLADAHARYEAATEAVEELGESELRRLADARERLNELFDRYEDRATGTGDFTAFIEFQGGLDSVVSELPEDLAHREAFEAAEDAFDKRRLNEGDFERARELLAPVDDDLDRLEERAAAREDLREARRAAETRIETLEERIDEYDRLLALSDIDLDAPVADLRVPIEGYNDAVEAAFSAYLDRTSAREVAVFLDRTELFPLVDTPQVPADLRAYIERAEAGTEPIPTLLEYAGYSRSKLDHYVADADALKRAVATQRTALERIDAEPFRLEWPPRPAAELRFRLRELRAVVGRFAPEETVARLREVETVTRDPDYERLRRAAEARERLDERERTRLVSGAIAAEREAASEEKRRLEEVLSRYAPTISSS